MRKILLTVLCVITAITIVSVLVFVPALADNVVIYEETDPTLKFAKIKGGYQTWDSSGTLEQQNGTYTINTNSYCVWYGNDGVDFAYNKYNFNFGKKAELTLETSIASWSYKMHENASCGLLIRSGLENDAATVFLHVRSNALMIVYRSSAGTTCLKGPEIDGRQSFPLGMKMTVKGNKVTCYYRLGNKGSWIEIKPTLNFIYDSAIYAGVAAHSCLENTTETAVFDGWNAQVSAPEGTDYNAGGIGDDSSETESKVTLPEDSPVTEDVLLRETFTDGDIYGGTEGVTNPVWKTNYIGTSDLIILDEAQSNRFMRLDFEEGYFTAGDSSWSDYSLDMNVRFSSGILEEEAKTFMIYTRLKDIAGYGFNCYSVCFTGGDKLEIWQTNYQALPSTIKKDNEETCLASVDFNYLASDFTEKFHAVKVVSFDNEITVYIDENKVISAKDDTAYFKGTGKIGYYASGICVDVDDITVKKLTDYLGGGYDNIIGGRFDKAVPDYVDEYVENDWYSY